VDYVGVHLDNANNNCVLLLERWGGGYILVGNRWWLYGGAA